MDEHLLKKEIPIHCLEDNACQVTVPLHPKILSLEKKIRFDKSIPRSVLKTITEEYNTDMKHYLAALSQEQIKMIGLEPYKKFSPDWHFSFRKSNKFLDLVWTLENKVIEMGYCPVPVAIGNIKEEFGLLAVAEDSDIHTDINLIYKDGEKINIVFFPKEKFEIYKGFNGILDRDDKYWREVSAHAFVSTYIDNVAEGILLRNFFVKYLNKLLAFCD